MMDKVCCISSHHRLISLISNIISLYSGFEKTRPSFSEIRKWEVGSLELDSINFPTSSFLKTEGPDQLTVIRANISEKEGHVFSQSGIHREQSTGDMDIWCFGAFGAVNLPARTNTFWCIWCGFCNPPLTFLF